MPIQAFHGETLPGSALAHSNAMLPAMPQIHPNMLLTGLGRIGLAIVTAPLWLAMVLFAAVMLVVMLVTEPLLMAVDAVRPGQPVRRWRTRVLR
ncbi:hypothetical protein [Sandarakinorhabdus sp. AAP62]|uniref:hypothetical protein n=1 Tax=Sandarakinorhabdus sp. AAP62 TaxID=1248916 RepID=UPI00030D6845|nr:hypothetical protein [Sandarakinorhabdus sp. AAP62]